MELKNIIIVPLIRNVQLECISIVLMKIRMSICYETKRIMIIALSTRLNGSEKIKIKLYNYLILKKKNVEYNDCKLVARSFQNKFAFGKYKDRSFYQEKFAQNPLYLVLIVWSCADIIKHQESSLTPELINYCF
ncbi:hypothetical protein BpHYR1_033085 [Brachionus plicatilis]|uniref:Uncharacterized protein n=1 Tax=Brachionus plicatilis TaxID=10195 RepID=A0A3M7RI74_BRAPC|nr:hypothetical protein BpHYR1_033085 [Brachionus plicatilis]